MLPNTRLILGTTSTRLASKITKVAVRPCFVFVSVRIVTTTASLPTLLLNLIVRIERILRLFFLPLKTLFALLLLMTSLWCLSTLLLIPIRWLLRVVIMFINFTTLLNYFRSFSLFDRFLSQGNVSVLMILSLGHRGLIMWKILLNMFLLTLLLS